LSGIPSAVLSIGPLSEATNTNIPSETHMLPYTSVTTDP
jgi:hypothetical protein